MGNELRTERELSLDFLRVCEAAAIAAARTMGQGDRKYSDHVAVEAMREVMDTVPMRGRIVIGEGERDEAPMLYIGEEVGGGFKAEEDELNPFPEVDIAVDPLEGTNLCALGANNAIAVLAAAEHGGLLNAPDIYMDKIFLTVVLLTLSTLLASGIQQQQEKKRINGYALGEKDPPSARTSFSVKGPQGNWTAAIVPDLNAYRLRPPSPS